MRICVAGGHRRLTPRQAEEAAGYRARVERTGCGAERNIKSVLVRHTHKAEMRFAVIKKVHHASQRSSCCVSP